MYLVPIHVPVYGREPPWPVATEWKRSLELLRDSFQGRFGDIVVLAPTMPAASSEQPLQTVSRDEGIRFVPSFDLRCRTIEFWSRHNEPWLSQARPLIEQCTVLHGCLNEVNRPFPFEAFALGVRSKKPTVFVQDTDIVAQMREMAVGKPLSRRATVEVSSRVYEQACRFGVARAGLSLIKGRNTIRRYQRYARNIREIEDTSYYSKEIVDPEIPRQRLRGLLDGNRVVRFVYCGRLVSRKGVKRSLRLLGAAARAGARFQFDIIGSGNERADLESEAAKQGIVPMVTFVGSLEYGPELLKRLATYDALLFTPEFEDTPRMIFDAYAAGIPVIGAEIEYVKQRAESERATILLSLKNDEAAAAVLRGVCRDASLLVPVTENAIAAAREHACDVWYQRRAEWTFEMVAKHQSAQRASH